MEEELKKEIWRHSKLRKRREKKQRRGEDVPSDLDCQAIDSDERQALEDDKDPIPEDLLITEKINAKLF